jgi:hypothetical protein
MRLKLRKIGNSYGVIVPRIIVKAYEKEGFIELIVKEMLYEEIGKNTYPGRRSGTNRGKEENPA